MEGGRGAQDQVEVGSAGRQTARCGIESDASATGAPHDVRRGHDSPTAVLDPSLRVAEARFGELRALDERVLATPVDSSNSRVLDEELTVGLYHVGSEMILNTILAVHQLVLEMEVAGKIKPKPFDNLNDRLIRALRATGSPADLGKDPRYGQFAELQRVRDAIEHPQEDNI